MVAACALAAMLGAPAGAGAQSPDPAPLWKAYPLDEGATAKPQTTQAQPTPSPTTPTARPELQASDEAGDGPPWLLIGLAGIGGALFMTAVLAAGRRRDGRHEPPAPPLPATANGRANGHVPREAVAAALVAPSAPREPAFEVPEAVSVPIRRFDREPGEPAPTPQQRAAAARRGPICQVTWDAERSRFRAVATDEGGIEHELARSLRFDWHGPQPPPSDHRPAQSALRVLAKDLREKGWRPMRNKGTDLDAPRWYARRFRFPVVDGEDEQTAWGAGAPGAQPSSSQITLT